MKTEGYVIFHSNISMFLIAKHTQDVLRDWPWYGIQKALEGFMNIFTINFFKYFFLAFKHH